MLNMASWTSHDCSFDNSICYHGFLDQHNKTIFIYWLLQQNHIKEALLSDSSFIKFYGSKVCVKLLQINLYQLNSKTFLSNLIQNLSKLLSFKLTTLQFYYYHSHYNIYYLSRMPYSVSSESFLLSWIFAIKKDGPLSLSWLPLPFIIINIIWNVINSIIFKN